MYTCLGGTEVLLVQILILNVQILILNQLEVCRTEGEGEQRAAARKHNIISTYLSCTYPLARTLPPPSSLLTLLLKRGSSEVCM